MDLPFHLQGKSLLPVLQGQSTHHRDFVRTECFGAINFPDQTHATVYAHPSTPERRASF